MQFYEYFLQLCANKGVSPTKASKDMKLSTSAQTRWAERGSRPTNSTLMKVAIYFNLPFEEVSDYDKQTEAPAVADAPAETTADKIDIAVRKINVVDQDKLYKYIQLMYPEAFEDKQ